jgi:hypothetical protein
METMPSRPGTVTRSSLCPVWTVSYQIAVGTLGAEVPEHGKIADAKSVGCGK